MSTFSYNYIGSGTYGCIISPSHSCEGKQEINTQNISKLFNDKQIFEDEINVHTYIQKDIDPEGNFTVKMINSCSIENKNFLPKIKKFNKCDLININTPHIYQINYEYGGIDLDVLVTEHFENINKTLLKTFVNIFIGISVLNAKSIIHHDIKLNNIVYDKLNNKFSLIDFGLMTTGDKIYDISFLLINKKFLNYFTFPPEYSYIYNALHNNNQPINVQNINSYKFIFNFNDFFKKINKLLKTIRNQNRIYLEKINEIKTNITNQYLYNSEMNKFNIDNSDKDNYINNLLKIDDKIKKKIDVYMLGLTLYLFISLTIYNKVKANSTCLIDIPIEIFDLIKKMVHINPFTRISIEEAIIEYNKLFT